MAGDTIITVVGNLTADPELRFTASGAAVASFTVASTPRTFDRATNEWKDGEALFLRCSIWRQAAENVAESLTRGARVVVVGRLKQRSFDTKEGEKRTVIELEADEVGASLQFATAKITRTGGGSRGNGNAQRVRLKGHKPAGRKAPDKKVPDKNVPDKNVPGKEAAPTTAPPTAAPPKVTTTKRTAKRAPSKKA